MNKTDQLIAHYRHKAEEANDKLKGLSEDHREYKLFKMVVNYCNSRIAELSN